MIEYSEYSGSVSWCGEVATSVKAVAPRSGSKMAMALISKGCVLGVLSYKLLRTSVLPKGKAGCKRERWARNIDLH